MDRLKILSLLLIISASGLAQGTKIMDESVYEEWTRIEDEALSPKGNFVVYETERIKNDPSVIIHDLITSKDYSYSPASSFKVDYNGDYVFFLKTNPRDSVRQWKREKVDKKDFPNDILTVFNYAEKTSYDIQDVKQYFVPKKWSGYIACIQEVKGDSTTEATDRLLLINLNTNVQDTFVDIDKVVFAEEKPFVYMTQINEEDNSGYFSRIDLINANRDTLYEITGETHQLSVDKNGLTAALVVNLDTTESKPILPTLLIAKSTIDKAIPISDLKPKLLSGDMRISPDFKPDLSEDGNRLYFGIANLPLEQDTNLLEEDIVNVEIWNYMDQKLYTVQENELEKTKKKSFVYALDLIENDLHKLANEELPNVLYNAKSINNTCLLWTSENYQKYMSWEGYTYRDVYLYDFSTKQKKKIVTKEPGQFKLSPDGNYAIWFNREEQIWKTLNTETGEVVKLNKTDDKFGNEIHDLPTHPWSYGVAYWTEMDKAVVINDRYDLWSFDPELSDSGQRLTEGREANIQFRYIDTDKENEFVKDGASIMLKLFNEEDKQSGYVTFNPSRNLTKIHTMEDYAFSGWMEKSRDGSKYMFTKQNFNTFPDLLICENKAFDTPKQITNVNPQQEDYAWGTMHLVNWKTPKGDTLTGMLVKPGNFDPSKSYPVIINFYERSSNRLHRHRAPYPHRSTINYSYYANRGYVILNVDVHYEIGYPGKSALNTVMQGVDFLKQFSWADQKRMALQGHSWGGYQIADILTRTDIFKCAESGAPVVNMTSAYGGIRWGSGLSRMFQYERTQSRIGATLWEEPELYIENSPIFKMDKVNTPVLILHNDKDGAVPWYQGIEYFVALRRLGKPAWLLNYNDEPHWPVKLQNRLDFNKRMEQFFDHYLMGKEMPEWMKTGLPPIEKGINQRY